MVKKKDENVDLTRIEDLSEFLHQEDSDLDSRFDTFSKPAKESTATGISLEDLDNVEDGLPDIPPQLPEESLFEPSSLDEVSFEETSFEDSTEQTSFGQNPFSDSMTLEDESLPEISIEEPEGIPEELQNEEEFDIEVELESEVEPEPIYTNTSEKFEDVKTFAQNFSYGKTSLGGGNPPYTIIARNIKFIEDAADILDLLREFGVVTDQNEKDTEKSLEFGSLIIPQISEYTAIVLAHKLRRFDLDLEVGLSDEIHPSKSGDTNPKGLLKKDSLKQNKTESLKVSEMSTSIKDIIVSTTAQIPGYFVESYIGVQTTFSIVEEAELEKLQYVEKTLRSDSELFDYNSSELTTEKVFQDYQNSFSLLYDDLAMQLKQKAFAQNANALLGLNFQLSPLQFERAEMRINAYQITCSATLAIVGKEKS